MGQTIGLPWDLPPVPQQTVGWVFRAEPDESMDARLRPGRTHEWGDARLLGKEPGQPVLYLRSGPRFPSWVGWGRVVAPEERWRSFGVRTVCVGAFRPPLRVADSPGDGMRMSLVEGEWENRALGVALGFLRYRDRTPYREVGATDFRLTLSDLRLLARAQPRLREMVPSASATPG